MAKVKVKVTQSCTTFCHPTDYTVHGILQARILEWVTILFPRRSPAFPNPGIKARSPTFNTNASLAGLLSLPLTLGRDGWSGMSKVKGAGFTWWGPYAHAGEVSLLGSPASPPWIGISLDLKICFCCVAQMSKLLVIALHLFTHTCTYIHSLKRAFTFQHRTHTQR